MLDVRARALTSTFARPRAACEHRGMEEWKQRVAELLERVRDIQVRL